MVEIEQIVINGMSTGGPFAGSLTLDSGLQIISGKNHFGKSLTATAITWCLAVEPMFGIQDNQPLCFPEAAYERLTLEGVKHDILSSRGGLFIRHHDGRKLQLWRDIKGNTTVVHAVTVTSSGETKTLTLSTRYETMQDETGGFQYFLFEWMGWPRERVSTFRSEAWLYLENLAPLFYIDQAEGWTNIQALQISRYGQQKISETAVEYLLGGVEAIRQRFARQQGEQRDQSLRDEARLISARVHDTLLHFGWDLDWSAGGTVSSIAKRWSATTLPDTLLKNLDVDIARSQSVNLERMNKIRSALTKEHIEGETTVPAEVSQAAIDLKARRNDLSKQLHTLRLQSENALELTATIESKIKSASDLLRYKKSHVGRLEVIECPTCHRDLDPDTFALQQQSETSVESHLQALIRDRALMMENVTSMANSVATTTAELRKVDDNLETAESAVRMVTESTSPAREQMARLAIALSAAEREYQRLEDAAGEIESLQKHINEWTNRSADPVSLPDPELDLKGRVEQFSTLLLQYLRAFAHMALEGSNPGLFYLDPQYVPYLEGRRLRSLGSASDQARLVAAYSLALAVTSEIKSGFHPGFVVLDEPLQQNPDPEHRKRFVKFLGDGLSAQTKIQVIVFTNLHAAEIATLRARGRQVKESEGVHFLKPLNPNSVERSR